jgi:hypothetical protein
MVTSTKPPVGTVALPDEVQLPPDETAQLSPVFAILPGVPARSVTVTVFDCCENASSSVAVHPAGTHDSTEAVSVALEFGLFTE